MKISPKVFISYAHDTDSFADVVLDFSNRLRDEGVDANIDQFEESPAQGWPRWMDEEIENADYVIVICTKRYYENITNYKSGNGKGVNWEIALIYQKLYESCGQNHKFIPVILDSESKVYILNPLKSATFYNIDSRSDFQKLCNRLKGIRNVKKHELGYIDSPDDKLVFKERKHKFVTNMIDADKWKNAGWSNFLCNIDKEKKELPIFGLVFSNSEIGRSIFESWRSTIIEYFDNLYISVIEGPDNECIVFLSSNMMRVIESAENWGLHIDDTTYMTTDTYLHVKGIYFTTVLHEFKSEFDRTREFFIAPFGLIGSSSSTLFAVKPHLDLKIKMRNIKFLKFDDITENDVEYRFVQNDKPTR